MKVDVRIGSVSRIVHVSRIADGRLAVTIENSSIHVDVASLGVSTQSILLNGKSFDTEVIPQANGFLGYCAGHQFSATVRDPRAWRPGNGNLQKTHGRQQVLSPMQGRVVRVLVAPGDAVDVRQGLVVVEAMKMQNEIRAPKSGVVESVSAAEGQTVAAGEALLIIA
jgi:biotin carboxyl carrier protein